MTMFSAPSKEQLQPVVDFLAEYSKLQEEFTKGTRMTGVDGWTSMTLEWGKRNKENQQMISLEAALQQKFPNDVAAVGGAVRLLEIASGITGAFRIQARPATWTPKRGRNAGQIQTGQLHDVFFPSGVTRPVYNPFAASGQQPIGETNPTPGMNPAQVSATSGERATPHVAPLPENELPAPKA